VSLPAEIVSDPAIIGGQPSIRGTRIPVEMILVHLRAGYSWRAIFENYPSLPLDGIVACVAWAEKTLGPDRRKEAEKV
jgi:uncharacterized protein (DUF433 family)